VPDAALAQSGAKAPIRLANLVEKHSTRGSVPYTIAALGGEPIAPQAYSATLSGTKWLPLQ